MKKYFKEIFTEIFGELTKKEIYEDVILVAVGFNMGILVLWFLMSI